MTERLYYQDAYLREFAATVLSCQPVGDRWEVVLDRTAFYPEGGGQNPDTGVLGKARVLDTQERGEQVVHTTDRPLELGSRVEGRINWAERFSRMQHHTGEHMLSGTLHRLYGVDNVGFHMGHDAVTLDLSAELDAAQLEKAETLVNRAIWEDLPVRAWWPEPEELAHLDYRSKRKLTGAVRIVQVAEVDRCACCGTHVSTTGQIGMVKILHFQRYKGGVRLWILCGDWALEDYRRKNADIYRLSEQFSAKPLELVPAAQRLLEEQEHLKQQLAAVQRQLWAYRAAQIPEGAPLALAFEEGLDPAQLRRLCLAFCERAGLAAVFAGGPQGWKYAVGSAQRDVRELGKRLNQRFSGRGGGQKELVQGTLTASRRELEAFFQEEAGV